LPRPSWRASIRDRSCWRPPLAGYHDAFDFLCTRPVRLETWFATADGFRQSADATRPHPYSCFARRSSENPVCAALARSATKRPHSKPTAIQKGLAIGGGWSGTAVNSGRPERSEILPRRLRRPRWGFGGAAAEPPLTEWRIPMSKSAKKRTTTATSATAATKTAQQSQNERKLKQGGVVLQAIACFDCRRVPRSTR
jgi:hypothetical protein